jgi:hypothetical protein
MNTRLHYKFRGDIQSLSLNALLLGKRDEVSAYMSAVKAWTERSTGGCERLRCSSVVVLTCYFPHKGVAVDSDNNALTLKAIIDGLKKYVLLGHEDGLASVAETRMRSRIGGSFFITVDVYAVRQTSTKPKRKRRIR